MTVTTSTAPSTSVAMHGLNDKQQFGEWLDKFDGPLRSLYEDYKEKNYEPLSYFAFCLGVYQETKYGDTLRNN